MKTPQIPMTVLALEQSRPMPAGTWILLAVFFALFVWAVFYLRQKNPKLDKKKFWQIARLLILFILVNLIGIKVDINALDIADVFGPGFVYVAFLHIPLSVFALGLDGLEPAFIIGFLSGLAQVIFFKQDPALLVLLPGLPVILSKFLTFPQLQRSQWREKNHWMFFLLTWFSTIPLILILIGTRTLFLRLDFGWHVLRYCLFVWLSLLPGMILSAILYWALHKWFRVIWRLEDFIRKPNNGDELKSAIDQIRLLSNGTYDQELLAKPSNPKERGLYLALERLRKNLQFRHEAQSRLLSLDPTHYSKEGYDLILSSVLRAALTRDASSARLLLLDDSLNGELPNIRSRFGQGENTRLYAYLDAKILDKIGHLDQLVLTDIKVDQYFGLSANTPYPQSIIALPLTDKGHLHGILWVGFEQKKWFSPEDIKFYQELAFRASVTMSTKQETQQLLTDKNTFESTLDTIPHAIFILDKEHHITFMNESAKGLAREANDLLKLEDGKHLFKHQGLLDLLNVGGQHQVYDGGIELANGSSFDMEFYPLTIFGKEDGAVVLLVDNAWLTQINQQRTEFISNISHDLQSPIKMIKGHLILLQRMGNLNKEQQTYVKLIEDNTENMNRLVNKMLNLERLDTVEAINYVRFDFQEKTDEVVRLLTPTAQQKKISILTNYSKMATPFISADQTLIQQAMYNLIENAIKFSPMGAEVQVIAEKDASWLHVRVEDKGKGIAPIDQPSLFNRFYHLDENESFENTVSGMGLAIVKSIAEKHAGSVRVESQLGEGSKFFFDIPIHKLS